MSLPFICDSVTKPFASTNKVIAWILPSLGEVLFGLAREINALEQKYKPSEPAPLQHPHSIFFLKAKEQEAIIERMPSAIEEKIMRMV